MAASTTRGKRGTATARTTRASRRVAADDDNMRGEDVAAVEGVRGGAGDEGPSSLTASGAAETMGRSTEGERGTERSRKKRKSGGEGRAIVDRVREANVRSPEKPSSSLTSMHRATFCEYVPRGVVALAASAGSRGAAYH